MTEEQYEKIVEYIKNQPGLMAKIKMKYKNGEWQQVTNKLDIRENYHHVKSVCDENLICWMDAMNYTAMKQTTFTEDVYQFISHRAGVIREGFEENFWRGIDEQIAKESALIVYEKGVEFLRLMSGLIF